MADSSPDPTRWFSELMARNQSLLQSLMPAEPAEEGAAAPAFHPFAPWLQAVETFGQWQKDALDRITAAWTAALPGGAEAGGDRRFAGEAWRSDPRFDVLAKAYLQQSELMRKALAAAPIDERSKAQWSFVLRQATDALSPANALATNPEALQLALQSGGASLVEGMKLFMQDLAKGRVSMTDETAFEVGRNVATSPGQVVYQNEVMQLIQYAPSTAQVHARPLVIVPPCINKFYILDLQPENSFVGYAAAQGHTVFLVSWRNVGPEQGMLRWDDYLDDGVVRAIDVALEITGADRANTLGFCIGGTLLSTALAVLAARGEQKAASLTLLTTMLDFSDTGEIGLLVNEPAVKSREMAIGQGGLLKGSELAQVFAALRANDLIWPYVVAGYLKGKAPPAFDLLYWNSDDTNLPGPMFCWYIRNAYLENRLREPGATEVSGQAIDFGRIDVPAFVYASREDHIVPWQTAYGSTALLGGDTRFVLGASGHIAGVINPPAKKKRNFWHGDVQPTADGWLAAAQSEPGSWWPVWSAWLAGHAGGKVDAPKKAGSRSHPPIEPAPGSYVKAKAP